jgi:hypothetical protein
MVNTYQVVPVPAYEFDSGLIRICQAFLLFSIWFKYEIWTNLLKYSIYGNECAGNFYPSKYSKYNKELPKDMQLYIHHSLPCGNGVYTPELYSIRVLKKPLPAIVSPRKRKVSTKYPMGSDSPTKKSKTK